MSEKIKQDHIERKAILYVRQSSAYQVQNNLESQKLQYAMQDRLRYPGWQEIEIVDEDLGRTASGTVTRAGFERRSVPRAGGRGGGQGSLAFRQEQPGMAKAGRGLSGGGYTPDRPGDGRHAPAE